MYILTNKNINIKIQMKINAHQKLRSVNINHLTTNLNNKCLLTISHSVYKSNNF